MFIHFSDYLVVILEIFQCEICNFPIVYRFLIYFHKSGNCAAECKQQSPRLLLSFGRRSLICFAPFNPMKKDLK